MYKKVKDGIFDLGIMNDTHIVCDFNRGIIYLIYLKYEKTEYIAITDINHHYFSRRFWYEHWRNFLQSVEGLAAYNKMVERRTRELSFVG